MLGEICRRLDPQSWSNTVPELSPTQKIAPPIDIKSCGEIVETSDCSAAVTEEAYIHKVW